MPTRRGVRIVIAVTAHGYAHQYNPLFDPAVTAHIPFPCGGSRPRRGRGGPAVTSTAQTGRTHDLHPTTSRSQEKSLDPWSPSTHDPESTSTLVVIGPSSGRDAQSP